MGIRVLCCTMKAPANRLWKCSWAWPLVLCSKDKSSNHPSSHAVWWWQHQTWVSSLGFSSGLSKSWVNFLHYWTRFRLVSFPPEHALMPRFDEREKTCRTEITLSSSLFKLSSQVWNKQWFTESEEKCVTFLFVLWVFIWRQSQPLLPSRIGWCVVGAYSPTAFLSPCTIKCAVKPVLNHNETERALWKKLCFLGTGTRISGDWHYLQT